MFDWALFEALHTYVKMLAYYGEELPLSVTFILGNMTFTFLMLFVVAALWTIQFSDHVAQVFDNTINIMLEFQVSLQHVVCPSHGLYVDICWMSRFARVSSIFWRREAGTHQSERRPYRSHLQVRLWPLSSFKDLAARSCC